MKRSESPACYLCVHEKYPAAAETRPGKNDINPPPMFRQDSLSNAVAPGFLPAQHTMRTIPNWNNCQQSVQNNLCWLQDNFADEKLDCYQWGLQGNKNCIWCASLHSCSTWNYCKGTLQSMQTLPPQIHSFPHA